MNKTLSVMQLNSYVKSILDGDVNLSRLFVVGEISNYKVHYKSGHAYFSLKDDKAVVNAIMYSSVCKRLKFAPKDGMKVIVQGRISLYEASGQYQLYVDGMQPDGLGALNLAYEQLWEKLNKEGLFSENAKKSLPKYPEKIGVITSTTGAAINDIVKNLEKRWPVAQVNVYGCTVQGVNAVPELLSALNKADNGDNDIIIIGRGGGSLEDLWEFNDETLARSIYSAKTPIVSAVGHEHNFTICDYVADLRVSTPTAAAQYTVPNIIDERENVLYIKSNLNKIMKNRLNNYTLKLDYLTPFPDILNKRLDIAQTKTDNASKEFKIFTNMYLEKSQNKVVSLANTLNNLNPLQVMTRGYSLLQKNDKIINSVNDFAIGDKVTAVLKDGTVNLQVIGEE